MTDTVLPELQLSAIEARVLGALLEKQLTTPDVYPLTLNSLILACNQKTSREPVSHYTSGDVQHCLRGLEERKLVDIDYGSRADRYAQRLSRALGIDKRVQALLSILLLRGPQTVNELLLRTQRMHEFASSAEVEETLQHLCEKVSPIIMRVPRQVGQREDRFVHLLSGMPDITAMHALSSAHVARANDQHDSSLEIRINLLEEKIAVLEKQLAVLLLLNGVNEVEEGKLA